MWSSTTVILTVTQCNESEWPVIVKILKEASYFTKVLTVLTVLVEASKWAAFSVSPIWGEWGVLNKSLSALLSFHKREKHLSLLNSELFNAQVVYFHGATNKHNTQTDNTSDAVHTEEISLPLRMSSWPSFNVLKDKLMCICSGSACAYL